MKQACRDELVVYLFFSPIYILLYFHVLSTVLRTSSLHFIYLYIYIYIYIFIAFILLRGRAVFEMIDNQRGT